MLERERERGGRGGGNDTYHSHYKVECYLGNSYELLNDLCPLLEILKL